jgi:hypothetical protein
MQPVYLAAIAELYSAQVSMGVNKQSHFRGAALKRLVNGLARQQMQRRQGAFEDWGSGSINDGYSTEQFLLMQDQLLAWGCKEPLGGPFPLYSVCSISFMESTLTTPMPCRTSGHGSTSS